MRPLLALVLVAVPAAAPAQERLTRPPVVTPTVVVPGPGWITAGSDYPTHMTIKWSIVPGATLYRVYRTSSFDGRWLRVEKNAAALASPTEPGYAVAGDLITYPTYHHSLTESYSYEVQAVFYDARGNVTYSGMSQAASAVSLPFMAPGNYRWTVGPGADKKQLRLTVTWDAVPGAFSYLMTGTETVDGYRYTIPQAQIYRDPTVVFDASQGIAFIDKATLIRKTVKRGTRYDLCFVTWYPNGIREDNLQSCVTVQL